MIKMKGWSPECKVCGKKFEKKNVMLMINHWKEHKNDGSAPKTTTDYSEMCNALIKHAKESKKDSGANLIAPLLRNINLNDNSMTEESKKAEMEAYKKVMEVVEKVKSKPGYKSPVVDFESLLKRANISDSQNDSLVNEPYDQSMAGSLQCKKCGMSFNSFFKARDHHQMHKKEILDKVDETTVDETGSGESDAKSNGNAGEVSKTGDAPEVKSEVIDISDTSCTEMSEDFKDESKPDNLNFSSSPHSSKMGTSAKLKIDSNAAMKDDLLCVVISDSDSDSDSHLTPLAYDYAEFAKAAEEIIKKRLSSDSLSANSTFSKISTSSKTKFINTTPERSQKTISNSNKLLTSSPVNKLLPPVDMDISSDDILENNIVIVSAQAKKVLTEQIKDTMQENDTASDVLSESCKNGANVISTTKDSSSDFPVRKKFSKKKKSRRHSKTISTDTGDHKFPFSKNISENSSIVSAETDTAPESSFFKPLMKKPSKPRKSKISDKTKDNKNVVSVKKKQAASRKTIQSDVAARKKKTKKVKKIQRIMESDSESDISENSSQKIKIVKRHSNSGAKKPKKSVWDDDLINPLRKSKSISRKSDNYDRAFDVTDTEDESTDSLLDEITPNVSQGLEMDISNAGSDTAKTKSHAQRIDLKKCSVNLGPKIESINADFAKKQLSVESENLVPLSMSMEEEKLDTENDLESPGNNFYPDSQPFSEISQELGIDIDTQALPENTHERSMFDVLSDENVSTDTQTDGLITTEQNGTTSLDKNEEIKEFFDDSQELTPDTQVKTNFPILKDILGSEPAKSSTQIDSVLNIEPQSAEDATTEKQSDSEERLYETLRKMYEPISDEESQSQKEEQTEPNKERRNEETTTANLSIGVSSGKHQTEENLGFQKVTTQVRQAQSIPIAPKPLMEQIHPQPVGGANTNSLPILNDDRWQYLFASTVGVVHPYPASSVQSYQMQPQGIHQYSQMQGAALMQSPAVAHQSNTNISSWPQSAATVRVNAATAQTSSVSNTPALVYESLSEAESDGTIVNKQSNFNARIMTQQSVIVNQQSVTESNVPQLEKSYEEGKLIIDTQATFDDSNLTVDSQSKCPISPDLALWSSPEQTTLETPTEIAAGKTEQQNIEMKEEYVPTNDKNSETLVSIDEIGEAIILRTGKSKIKKEYRPANVQEVTENMQDYADKVDILIPSKRKEKITPTRRKTVDNSTNDCNMFQNFGTVISNFTENPRNLQPSNTSENDTTTPKFLSNLLEKSTSVPKMTHKKVFRASSSKIPEIECSQETPIDLSISRNSEIGINKSSASSVNKSNVNSRVNPTEIVTEYREKVMDLSNALNRSNERRNHSADERPLELLATTDNKVQNKPSKICEKFKSPSNSLASENSQQSSSDDNSKGLSIMDMGPEEPPVVKKRATARKSIRRKSSNHENQQQPPPLASLSPPETMQPIKTTQCDFCGKTVSSLQKDLFLHWQNDCSRGKLSS